ncbi:phospholipase A2 inhibitor and Ly6/PLAUR domain-containing protein-like [Amia ocellicauda]|uniref:phospholipase A2 inhibitor and Ly6/PLAUR domain-containing protein-like n=1 Tax=Amia ocellicauda TaxID=2972642 RepID=UPI003464BA4A
MKLLETVTLVCAVLSSAACLQCFQCEATSAASCTQTTNCTAGKTNCSATTTSVTHLGKTTEMTMKSCVKPNVCGEDVSINFGVHGGIKFSIKCCGTEKCNTENAPVHTDNTTNSLQCHTCDKENCTKTMNCLGAEDHCFKSSVADGNQTTVVKGCATSNICSDLPLKEFLNSFRVDFRHSENIVKGISCCKGKLCNNAKRAGQSLFLLLASLAPIALFV